LRTIFEENTEIFEDYFTLCIVFTHKIGFTAKKAIFYGQEGDKTGSQRPRDELMRDK